jgi:hypothetical protein
MQQLATQKWPKLAGIGLDTVPVSVAMQDTAAESESRQPKESIGYLLVAAAASAASVVLHGQLLRHDRHSESEDGIFL